MCAYIMGSVKKIKVVRPTSRSVGTGNPYHSSADARPRGQSPVPFRIPPCRGERLFVRMSLAPATVPNSATVSS